MIIERKYVRFEDLIRTDEKAKDIFMGAFEKSYEHESYHGSSVYDTKQMSRLIDNLIQDAKAVGLETMSERERSLLLTEWGKD